MVHAEKFINHIPFCNRLYLKEEISSVKKLRLKIIKFISLNSIEKWVTEAKNVIFDVSKNLLELS